MRLIDANVVMYSEGREHFYRDSCKIIMDSVDAWPDEFAIDTEVLQEILYVYSSRGELEKGLAVTERLLNIFSEIIPITATEITAAMRLMSEIRNLTARDAIHAAVVFENSLEGIISADQDYDRIHGLRRYDPMEVAAG